MSAAEEHEARAVRLIGDIDGTTPVVDGALLVGAAIASALLAISARLGEANERLEAVDERIAEVRVRLAEIRDDVKGGYE